MRYRVGTTSLALADLTRISEFLAEKNPRAADSAIELILEGIASLAEMPERGHLANGGDFRELYLAFGSGAYVIEYSIGRETILVLRIFHSLEDR